MIQIPQYSSELIALLDREFPHKCPTWKELTVEPHKVAAYSGKRELIDMLMLAVEDNDPNFTEN